MEKSVRFECWACRKSATVIEFGGTVVCVYCQACGTALDGRVAAVMHDTLLGRYRSQLAGNEAARTARRPSNRFADRRWPFVLTVAK